MKELYKINKLAPEHISFLNIDHRVSRVGGSSFLYNFKEEFLLKDPGYNYSFWIKPTE